MLTRTTEVLKVQNYSAGRNEADASDYVTRAFEHLYRAGGHHHLKPNLIIIIKKITSWSGER